MSFTNASFSKEFSFISNKFLVIGPKPFIIVFFYQTKSIFNKKRKVTIRKISKKTKIACLLLQ